MGEKGKKKSKSLVDPTVDLLREDISLVDSLPFSPLFSCLPPSFPPVSLLSLILSLPLAITNTRKGLITKGNGRGKKKSGGAR